VISILILDVYDQGKSEYEAVLRWGETEGTAINGETINFPIGYGKESVECNLIFKN
jgi:hypothetical protein